MPDRERWNDQAIDGLDRRVDATEESLRGLGMLPGAIGVVATKLDAVAKTVEEMRADQRAGRPPGAMSIASLALTFGGTIIVPIVVALIGAYFIVKTGLPR